MDNETKELLKQTFELSKQNNEMLTKLIRAQKRAMIYRIAYWAIIIFSTLGLFYFIQPYLGNILNIYTGGISGSTNFSDVTKNLSNKQQLLDLYKSLK